MERQWLRPKQAAEALGVSPHTLRKLLREHRIPVLQLERGWRIAREDLDALQEIITVIKGEGL